MAQEEAGFALYLAHQGVVYAVLAQLGIRRDRSDFQDWRDDGMLVYLNYFNRYRGMGWSAATTRGYFDAYGANSFGLAIG